jgi:hypothetical protein
METHSLDLVAHAMRWLFEGRKNVKFILVMCVDTNEMDGNF